jgi:hypothetical protein
MPMNLSRVLTRQAMINEKVANTAAPRSDGDRLGGHPADPRAHSGPIPWRRVAYARAAGSPESACCGTAARIEVVGWLGVLPAAWAEIVFHTY